MNEDGCRPESILSLLEGPPWQIFSSAIRSAMHPTTSFSHPYLDSMEATLFHSVESIRNRVREFAGDLETGRSCEC